MKQRKYRMQALAMLLGVIISNTCVPAVLGAEVEEEHLAVDSSKVVLAQDEHPAFCQEDLNENFEFYAAEESRVILPMMYSAEEVANVVGVVLDQETGQPVPGAIVVADKELFVTTDLDGRFQIRKPCSDFDVGYGGHYNGMCQMGAAELARLNYGNAEIRDYYYTNCIPLYCKMV